MLAAARRGRGGGEWFARLGACCCVDVSLEKADFLRRRELRGEELARKLPEAAWLPKAFGPGPITCAEAGCEVVVARSSESKCSSRDPERVLERRVVLLGEMVKWNEGMMGPGGCPGPAGRQSRAQVLDCVLQISL